MIPATPFGSTKVHGSVPQTLVEYSKSGTPHAEFIESYLKETVSRIAGVPLSDVEPHRDLESLGLDGRGIDALLVTLESYFSLLHRDRGIHPHLTVRQLVSMLQSEIASHAATGETGPHDVIAESPLSYGQRALWFLQQVDPTSVAYNVSYAAKIPTVLDPGTLERAFQKIVDRHSCLRSTFAAIGQEPVRLIHRSSRVAFTWEDGSSWDPQEWRDRFDEEMFRPFNLTTGPLMRVTVFTKSPTEHIVMLNMHHIVTDMWSYAIVMSEVAQVYQSEMSGESPHLPPLPMEYEDHVRSEAEKIAGPEGERHWTYWRERLRDIRGSLDLPTDYPRQSISTSRGSSALLVLDGRFTSQLKSHAQSLKCTLFTVLLGGFQTILYHYTGDEKFLVGSPKACRASGTARVVGYFVNPILLEADLSGNPRWVDFLGRLSKVVSESFAHDEFPFPLIVERLQPEREFTRTPLFQVLFSWQKTVSLVDRKTMASFALSEEGKRTHLAGLPMEPVSLPSRVVPFDLSLLVGESDGGITLTMEYNASLFEQATIQKMLERYRNVLSAAVENPQRCIDSIPLLTESEEQHVPARDRTDESPAGGPTVMQLIEEQTARSPDSVAVALGEAEVTYSEVNRRANRIARLLRSRGVTAETVVAMMLPRTPEAIIAIVGILKAGGVYLPIDPECPTDRLAFVLGDASPRLLVASRDLLSTRVIPPIEVLCLDEVEPEIAGESGDNPDWERHPLQAAYIIYTSGSTGLPKGVVVSHKVLALHCHSMQEHYHTCSTDVVLQFASLEFDASLEQFLVPLIAGAKVLLRDQDLWTPQEVFRKIREHAITVVNFPPAYWNQVVGWWAKRRDLLKPASLRLVIIGGDVLTPESVRLWSRVSPGRIRFLNAYGPTETGITATTHEIVTDGQHDAAIGRIPIGRPLGGRTVHILNRSLRPVPPGLPGELCIGGAALARGYLRRPDRTAEQFIPDPFSGVSGGRLYRTGDIARFRPDGAIEYLGRTDFQIKVRGFRVETGEIEAVLLRHPAVAEAVVVPREDLAGERRLVAYLVARPGEQVEEDDVRRFLQKSLPAYMLPSAYVLLEKIPLSAGGKIDRAALPVPDWEERLHREEYVAPRTPLEAELAAILAGVLGIARVGIYDNFFDLGGHSLLATQFVAIVRDKYEVDIPIREIFESPTIADLANVLVKSLATGEHDDTIAMLLAEVERLSDEGVKSLLQKERSGLQV